MNRTKPLLLALVLATAARAQNSNTSLSFDLKGLEPTDTLMLQWGANNKSMNPLIGKRAAYDAQPFVIPLDEPRLIILSLKGSQGSYELLASPGEEVNVSGRVKMVDEGRGTAASFRRIRVKGAALQDEYAAIMQSYRQHQDSLDLGVFNEYRDVYRLIEKAKANNDEQAIADMYQTLHGQSYIDRVMQTFQERQDYLVKTIDRYADSFMGPLLLLRLAGPLDKTWRPQYDKMSPAARQSYYGKAVHDEVYPQTMTGERASSVSVSDTLGNEAILCFNKIPGKYLILDFWASWCEPCRKEMPNLKRLYERFHSRGLDITGISADHDEEVWLEALGELDVPWANYLDVNRQAITEYKVMYIPSTFIIDQNGVIIAEKLRGKDLFDFIENLFK
ncbi:MAG: TlpA family protein disulfide reductase [Bacteroidaceae bacterium]|nr:TlpA family protein disulfide reductase [Bacteroidaceae bacterium]